VASVRWMSWSVTISRPASPGPAPGRRGVDQFHEAVGEGAHVTGREEVAVAGGVDQVRQGHRVSRDDGLARGHGFQGDQARGTSAWSSPGCVPRPQSAPPHQARHRNGPNAGSCGTHQRIETVADTGLRPPRRSRLPRRCRQPGAGPGMHEKVDFPRHRPQEPGLDCRGGLAAAGATTRHVRSGPARTGFPILRAAFARQATSISVDGPSVGRADLYTDHRPRPVGGAAGGVLGSRSQLSASRRGVYAPSVSGTARGRCSAPERSAGADCRSRRRSVRGRPP